GRGLELLGPFHGRVAIVGSHAVRLTAALPPSTPVAGRDDEFGAAIVTFLGERAVPAARQALLAELRARLPGAAPVVVIDHNQPRVWWRRTLGAAALALHGLGPQRARYPVARELAILGFDVERLRLAHGERVQLVAARRGRPCGPGGEQVERRGPEDGGEELS